MVRRMRQEDWDCYQNLARAFYNTNAVITEPDEALFQASFQEMMRSSTYLEGYMLEDQGHSAGYAILAKSFSAELGGMILWIDELYILPEYRSKGLGSELFGFVRQQYGSTAKRIRLEVDADNERAISLYHHLGFEVLPYQQMTMEPSV